MRTTTLHFLSDKHVLHVRACECIVHDARYGCVFCVHSPSNCRYYVPAIRNCMLKKVTHCPSSGLEECHHHEFQFCHEEFCHDEDDEDEVCGRFPCCSLYHIHPVFSDNNVVIIFTSFELLILILTHLFARMNWFVELLRFPPFARLVVADILFLLRQNLCVVVEVVGVISIYRENRMLFNFVFVLLS